MNITLRWFIGLLIEAFISFFLYNSVGNILANHGVAVGYSRTRDIFLELADRDTRANNYGANVFVSIHCNAFGDSSILTSRQNDLSVGVSKGILNYLGIPYQGGSSILYRVQVGAFSVRANAETLVQELKIKGYIAIVVTS